MREVNPNGVFFTADGHELVVENCTVEASPPQWTKEPPTVPGHYWVWQPRREWPCHGAVMTAMVKVDARLGGVCAWATKMNYGERLGSEAAKYGFWYSALWLGPIPAPVPPTKEMQE